MKKKKLVKFIVSIIVVLSIIIGTVSASAVAATDIFKDDYIPSRIVEEVKELREASSKTFLCEDGSYMAVTYAEPIHYKSGDDWVEIDNTLVFKDKETYMPKSTNTQIELPFNLAEGDIFLKSENADLTFGFDKSKESFNKKSFAKKVSIDELASNGIYGRNKQNENYKNVDNPEIAEIEKYNSEFTTIKNQKSALIYENVFPDTDVEYIISSNNLKENIVINKPQDKYIYTYILNTNLVPASNDNGTISFKDNNDKTVFSISAPYMYDMSRSESTEIKMTIDKSDEGFIVTVNADSNWINGSNRTYPVIIDPDITINIDPSEIDDVFVENGVFAGQTRSNNELRVGKNLTNITRTYIKTTLPTTIPFGSIITSAKLYLYKDYYYQSPSQENINIVACDCSSRTTWQSSSVTWNNQPFSNSANGYSSVSDCQLSSVEATSSKNNYEFELKVAAQKWLNTGVNKGIMLASSNENSKTQIDFHSTRSSTTDSVPKMTIKYQKAGVTPTTWKPVAEPSSQFITVTCNPSWTITSSESWLTYYGKTSSGFTAKVAKNTSTTYRDGTLTISSGLRKIGQVNVRQFGTDPSLLVDKTIIIKECGSCTDNFTITSNTSWTVSTTGGNWFSVTPTSGTGNGTINVTINNNEPENKNDNICKETNYHNIRTGSIRVNSGSLTKTINVKQLDEVSSYFVNTSSDGSISIQNPSDYSGRLAYWAMDLSYAAYNYPNENSLAPIYQSFMGIHTEPASNVLNNEGFTNIRYYNYDENQVGAHTIAMKQIPINKNGLNTNINLIVVDIRGSTTLQDWLTDLVVEPTVARGFYTVAEGVDSNLCDYMACYSLNSSNSIILFTGHSLGAAVANIIAHEYSIDENWYEKIYAYTFATPNVINNIHQNVENYDRNIFNILNTNDVVTYIPNNFYPLVNEWERYGIDLRFNIPLSFSNLNEAPLGFFGHLMCNYYEFLKSNKNETYSNMLIKTNEARLAGVLPLIAVIKCPVSVTAYDSDGNILAFESQEEGAQYPEIQNSNVVSFITSENQKVIFAPYYADVDRIKIEAYDTGTMNVMSYYLGSEDPDNILEYNNVTLIPGKEFQLDVTNCNADDEFEGHLYLMENGEIAGEITETNPHLISVDVENVQTQNRFITYQTFVTDNSVSEIRFRKTGVTNSSGIIITRNSSFAVISEDGDNLIWTVGIVHNIAGDFTYDVFVVSNNETFLYERAYIVHITDEMIATNGNNDISQNTQVSQLYQTYTDVYLIDREYLLNYYYLQENSDII